MNKATPISLILSLFVLSIGTVGGVAIAWKLAGLEKAIIFLHLGITIQVSIFLFQMAFFGRARKELLFQLYYFSSYSLTMVWTMLCLFFPIAFLDFIELQAKLVILLIALVVMYSNFRYAINQVRNQWAQAGAKEFEKLYRDVGTSIKWDRVAMSLKIAPVVYVPAIPQTWSPLVGACVVVSMLIGLNLRVPFPRFATFATGIPCVIAAAFFLQISGYYFMQARIVRSIEKDKRIKISLTE